MGKSSKWNWNTKTILGSKLEAKSILMLKISSLK